MKERLEQLTLSQFVDLVCGDTSVLVGEHEVADPNKLAIAIRNIVLEYRAIADPGGTGSYFKHVEDWIKAKINVIIFTMCQNLVTLQQFSRVRSILEDYGLPASDWSKKRIAGTIQAKLEQSQRELNDLEVENESLNNEREKIRSQFDAQTASLMAHFKFQIDPETIKATLYANLVARHNREINAYKAAYKNRV